MLITYLRSSSHNTYDFCPHKYFLSYGLGMREPSGKKATLGSIVHKVLEIRARQALALQQGKDTFRDEELDKTYHVSEVEFESSLEDAFEFYTKKESHHEWKPADMKFCRGSANMALDLNNGLFDPFNRKIVAPEQYFDIVIDKPWAHYEYKLPDGTAMHGQLAIKGTMDLIFEESPTVYEYCDWKTGKRLDWATGQEKTYDKLRKDPQLLLYFLALTEVFPQVEHFLMTIVYIADGGAFTMPYQRCVDRERAYRMLERRFTEIKNCYIPKLKKSWKCKTLCHFGKAQYPGSDKTICQYFADHVRKHGMDKTIAQYGDIKSITSYGDGGGQSNREEKNG